MDGTTSKASKSSKSNKRKRAGQSDDEDEEIIDSAPEPKKLASKNGSAAKIARVNVPVDERCDLRGSHSVYQDDEGTCYDVTLNQTNAGQNNNKFYRIQLLVDANGQDHRTWTRWGRVGEVGQSAMLGSGSLSEALLHFGKKFKDKTGHKWDDRHEPAKKGKYTYIERNYQESDDDGRDDLPGPGSRRSSKQSVDDDEVEVSGGKSKLPEAVQNLVSFIFNTELFNQTMASMDYDAHKMPLGKLSKRTLTQGYEILKEIATLIGDHSLAASQYNQSLHQAFEDLSNRYFSTIPHSFGRNRPPVIQDDRLMKKEIELIESLTDMQLANEIMKTARGGKGKNDSHLIDRQYEGLGLQEMTPCEPRYILSAIWLTFSQWTARAPNTKSSRNTSSIRPAELITSNTKSKTSFASSVKARVIALPILHTHPSRTPTVAFFGTAHEAQTTVASSVKAYVLLQRRLQCQDIVSDVRELAFH